MQVSLYNYDKEAIDTVQQNFMWN